MGIDKRIIAAAAALGLAGCAQQGGAPDIGTALRNAGQAAVAGFTGQPAGSSPGQPAPQGTVVGINGVLIAVDGPRPSDPRWAGQRISETPLAGYFAAHPSTRPGQYFPRLAIRIDDYSETLLEPMSNASHVVDPSGRGTPRPQECLKFDAALWTSDRQRQDFPGLVLCSSDIRRADEFMSQGALRNYANNVYAPISISSDQLRTMGPREPAKLLPNFSSDDVQLWSNGQALFSSMFVQLGYRGAIDGDQRLWFVNLAAKQP